MIIISEPLENLEQIPAGVVKQAIKLPGQIVSGAVKSILGKKSDSSGMKIDPLTGLEIPSNKQYRQLKKQEAKRKASGLTMMRQTISAAKPSNKPDVSQLPVYISGKPGFSADKTIKRMQGIETEKHELPPPVAAVKQKFSTGERKHGIGG